MIEDFDLTNLYKFFFVMISSDYNFFRGAWHGLARRLHL